MGRILQACIVKAAFRLTASRRVAHSSGMGTSNPQERYGGEEGADALFADAPPPGDEGED